MDVYLDDIIIYSDSLEDHLSATKLKFLCSRMKILGRIVDDDGIQMDLRGFLGAVGYLADDIGTVRIPMGILTQLTGSDTSSCTSS